MDVHDKFEGDIAIEQRVVGQKDFAHSTCAQAADYAI
jgi:hypothetical protein